MGPCLARLWNGILFRIVDVRVHIMLPLSPKASTLPQMNNMEAHKEPYIEDGSLLRGPLHFHVNLGGVYLFSQRLLNSSVGIWCVMGI